jgi:hypothetical protein
VRAAPGCARNSGAPWPWTHGAGSRACGAVAGADELGPRRSQDKSQTKEGGALRGLGLGLLEPRGPWWWWRRRWRGRRRRRELPREVQGDVGLRGLLGRGRVRDLGRGAPVPAGEWPRAALAPAPTWTSAAPWTAAAAAAAAAYAPAAATRGRLRTEAPATRRPLRAPLAQGCRAPEAGPPRRLRAGAAAAATAAASAAAAAAAGA